MVYFRLHNYLETEASGGVFEMWPIDGLMVTLSDSETMFCGSVLLYVLLDMVWWRL
jgi:hypothetical protein